MAITKREALERAAREKEEREEEEREAVEQNEDEDEEEEEDDEEEDEDEEDEEGSRDSEKFVATDGTHWYLNHDDPISYDDGQEEWRIYFLASNLHIEAPDGDEVNFPIAALYDLMKRNGHSPPSGSPDVQKIRDKVVSMIYHFKDSKSMDELLRVIDGK